MAGVKDEKKKSADSAIFYDASENYPDKFHKYLVTQALKRCSFISVCYPYKFAYCLVKFGYIPNSIAQFATEGGQRILRVPSVKEYMDFMKTNEGEELWMRGEIGFCLNASLYGLIEDCVDHYLLRNTKPDKTLIEEYRESLYVKSLSVLAAVVVTHPLTVLSYRQIGQYIGKEDIYSSAPQFISVFTKPGIVLFLEGILARYILYAVPTIMGNCAARTWASWLSGRTSFPDLQRFRRATRKYWVSAAISPLEIACISSCVWDSGIKIGSEPFVASKGHFIRRFLTMWEDGRLFRPISFYHPRFTSNLDSFVIL